MKKQSAKARSRVVVLARKKTTKATKKRGVKESSDDRGQYAGTIFTDAGGAVDITRLQDGSLTTLVGEWKRDDAAWFTKNKGISYRLRRAYADELKDWRYQDADASGLRVDTIVIQIRPGERMRLPAVFVSTFVGPDDESFARGVYVRLIERQPVTMAQNAEALSDMAGVSEAR